jgi:hypothetical protein
MDKRRHPRFEAAGLDVRLKVDGALVHDAVVENLSLGGALVGLHKVCGEGKNVLLEVGELKLVARVVAVLPRGHGRSQPALRLRFNPAAPGCTEKLYALIRDLPAEGTFAAAPTEAYEFHPRMLDEDDDDLTIDLVEEVLDDAPTVIDVMAQRIVELERQLATVRHNARTLEELLLPSIVGS